MRWKKRNIDLGNILVGKRKEITFQALEKLPIVKTLWSSCKCSKPTYNKIKKQLKVFYTPSSVPKHLKDRGWYVTKKSLGVLYNNGRQDILTFKAKIYKK